MMIGNIILWIIPFFTIVVLIVLIYKAIKKTNSITERILEIVLAVVLFSIVSIYYLDRFDIPTKLNWTSNIDTKSWLSFISSYLTGIITAVIAALVAVWTTIYQIKKNNEENEKRDKKNLKIQNMPILKYNINAEKSDAEGIDDLIPTNMDHLAHNIYYLNIVIKNIGMNNVRNIIIDFSLIGDSTYRFIGDGTINPLEKGDTIELNKYFSVKASDKPYEMKLIIYYQDLLSNWYKQKISINYYASNHYSKGFYYGSITYNVEKEIEIEEKEIIAD